MALWLSRAAKGRSGIPAGIVSPANGLGHQVTSDVRLMLNNAQKRPELPQSSQDPSDSWIDQLVGSLRRALTGQTPATDPVDAASSAAAVTPVLNEVSLNRVRARLLQMHYDNKVGHLGGNLSAIDAMLVLHHEIMRPGDRFVLSKGHSAGAYYATLWSLGKLTDGDLKTFHKDGTRLAGHPPSRGIPEIEFATGSLGHGLSLAAGLAMAAKLKGQAHRIYCLTSDGEWQEGSTLEALVFAIHQKLNNLSIVVDHNGLQGFGSTADVASMDPLDQKLAGFGIDLRRCDGHELGSLRQALAVTSPSGPALTLLQTHKGHGIPDFSDRMESHYLPVTDAQFQAGMAAFKGAS
jgi:transketolase